MFNKVMNYFTSNYDNLDNTLGIKAKHTVFMLLLICLSIIVESVANAAFGLTTFSYLLINGIVLLFFIGLLFLTKAKHLVLTSNLFLFAGFLKLVEYFDVTRTIQFFIQLFLVLIIGIAIYTKPYQFILVIVMNLLFVIAKIVTFDTANFQDAMIANQYSYQVYHASIAVLIFITSIIFFDRIIRREIETTHQLTKLSETDVLTNLFNRQKFDNVIANYHEEQIDYSLALLDIDHFKQINDTYGHQKGDEVLKLLAKKLLEIDANENIIFRWGGEEFAIILSINQTIDMVYNHLDLLREQISELDFGIDQSVTVSIGYVCSNEYQTSNAVMIYADQALYTAKSNGRNRIEFITSKEVW